MGRPPKIPYDEIPNMKFGKLKPIRMMNFGSGRTTWLCKCDCGKELEVSQKSLTTGNTKKIAEEELMVTAIAELILFIWT